MHKNIEVLDIDMQYTGYITKILDIYDLRHLPVGVIVTRDGVDRRSLVEWWLNRSIPTTRDGLSSAVNKLGIVSATDLLIECKGLSLSDHYWIREKHSVEKWETINYFNNPFSSDLGDILFEMEVSSVHPDLNSPDGTTDGWLRKRWVRDKKRLLLMKAGSGRYQQQSYNEVIASLIMQRHEIPHVEYWLEQIEGEVYCFCENMLTDDTELIPAYRIILTQKQPNNLSLRDHLLECSRSLTVPGVESALSQMLAIDYIIANEDRHWGNFGFIRNADTLEWLGMAPIYDSGTSLWYDTERIASPVGCMPFRKTHDEQIKLAGDLAWFDISRLDGLADQIPDIFAQSGHFDPKRAKDISSSVCNRAEQLARRSNRLR